MSASLVGKTNPPVINVTPLIDVLLVLLIIFMVTAPLKPHTFSAKVASKPDGRFISHATDTLVVTINPDRTLRLNRLSDDIVTVEDSSKLYQALVSLFKQRKTNQVARVEMLSRISLPDDYPIEKSVFINAPRSMPYGDVAKVIDAVKGAGADPVGLQLDNLN